MAIDRKHLAVIAVAAVVAAGAIGGFLTVLQPTPAPSFTAPPTTPEEVEQINAQETPANFGYAPNTEETKRFLESLPGGKQTLREQAPELFTAPSDGAVLLYPALYLCYEQRYPGSQWRVGAQGIGDCVSWGNAHACDHSLAVAVRLGEASEWRMAATEPIYGGSRVEARGVSRGGYSDGSYGGAAAKWLTKWGVLYRDAYHDPAGQLLVDLSKYSASRAKDWGNYGCGGRDDAGRLDELAKKHQIPHAALTATWSDAETAIRNGYAVAVCSGQGFSSTRDEQGFARASGSWAHCMCFIGVRYDREGLLCLNSWGTSWIRGPKWPTGEGFSPGHPRGPPPAQPDGSFWVDRRTVERMLAGRDSFAISPAGGWKARKLDFLEW